MAPLLVVLHEAPYRTRDVAGLGALPRRHHAIGDPVRRRSEQRLLRAKMANDRLGGGTRGGSDIIERYVVEQPRREVVGGGREDPLARRFDPLRPCAHPIWPSPRLAYCRHLVLVTLT